MDALTNSPSDELSDLKEWRAFRCPADWGVPAWVGAPRSDVFIRVVGPGSPFELCRLTDSLHRSVDQLGDSFPVAGRKESLSNATAVRYRPRVTV